MPGESFAGSFEVSFELSGLLLFGSRLPKPRPNAGLATNGAKHTRLGSKAKPWEVGPLAGVVAERLTIRCQLGLYRGEGLRVTLPPANRTVVNRFRHVAIGR